jgi:hypothetical protein
VIARSAGVFMMVKRPPASLTDVSALEYITTRYFDEVGSDRGMIQL